MPRQARGEYLNPGEVQVVHCVQRCVRRAFLCGTDEYTGQCFEHRRDWIRERLEFLASIFAIDCLTFAIMSNHLHVVCRSRPDVVAEWSDAIVARRWLRLFPQRRGKDGSPSEPEDHEISMITGDPERLAGIRSRLSDVSWWMRCTAENIARRSNKEDKCSGRFKAQLLLDEASILACAAYVDLNPIRAAIAKTPGTSKFTGAKERIDDLKQRQSKSNETHAWECSQRQERSGWLAPIEISEKQDSVGTDTCPSKRRASLKGFLPISLSHYLSLLDWTGRAVRTGKPGSIPGDLEADSCSTRYRTDQLVQAGQKLRQALQTSRWHSPKLVRRGDSTRSALPASSWPAAHGPSLASFTSTNCTRCIVQIA
ncbi:MAG: hypothetical protein AB8G99_07325 [Planctomycetaceae bacterium]